MGANDYDPAKDPFSPFYVDTPRLDHMASEDFASKVPPPPPPPVGEGDADRRFNLDMRDELQLDPIEDDDPVLVSEPETQITSNQDTGRFAPSGNEGMALPLLKACIMDSDNGETEFTEQIGRIYWQREGDHKPVCDPCSASDSVSGSGSGSSKCCIIEVPEWFWESRYTALFCMEAPEVRFEDFNNVTLTGRYTYTQLDPRYVEVCEPGTIMVRGVHSAKPGSYGATVSKDGNLEIDAGFFWWLKSRTVKVSLTGIRKGFGPNSSRDASSAVRFPRRTKEQFDKNEEFLKQAVDLEERI